MRDFNKIAALLFCSVLFYAATPSEKIQPVESEGSTASAPATVEHYDFIAEADDNQDGSVSLDEYLDYQEIYFERFDRDQDDYLNKMERENMAKSWTNYESSREGTY